MRSSQGEIIYRCRSSAYQIRIMAHLGNLFKWLNLMVALTLSCPAASPAYADLPCTVAQQRTFVWSGITWPDGALSGSLGSNEDRFAWSMEGNTNRFDIGEDGRQTPHLATTADGGFGGTPTTLRLRPFFQSTSEFVDVTLSVGQPGAGANGLSFAIFDVDGGPDWIDKLTFAAFRGSTSVPVALSGTVGSTFTISGQEATGTIIGSRNDSTSRLTVEIAGPVDRVVMRYRNVTPNMIGRQSIWMHDVTYCPHKIDVRVAKSSAPVSGFNSPQNDVIYAIEVNNLGQASVDTNALVVFDSLPGQLTLFNGDMDGAGPELGTVTFEDAASGMTFNPVTDIGYSNSATTPTAFAQCTYAPASGYDPATRHICIRPSGGLAAGGRFTLRFRSRID